MQRRRSIGVYSGTFDPIHSGHIAFAVEAMHTCGLDKVVFLPEPNPRNKYNVTELMHRLALITLAIEGMPGLESLKLTSERFTIRSTLPELRATFGDAYLTFLMGSDVAKSLGHWRDIKLLFADASLAIGLREKDDPDEIATMMRQLVQDQNMPINYVFISAARADMTSSRIRDGSADLSQLPPAVLQYIELHGLYGQTQDPVREYRQE